MSYEVLEKTYNTLTEEQQKIVYNLVVSLGKLNAHQGKVSKKREFGQFAQCASVTFSDNWELTEEDLIKI